MSPIIKRLGAKRGSQPWQIKMAYRWMVEDLAKWPIHCGLKAALVILQDIWAMTWGFEPAYRLWR